MNYKIARIRQGFWIVLNLYGERVYEGHTYKECLQFKERVLLGH